MAQTVKHLPTMFGDLGSTLGSEDLLEKGTAIHSGILAWKIPWTERPGGLQSMELQRVGHNSATSLSGLFMSKCCFFRSLFQFTHSLIQEYMLRIINFQILLRV